MIKHQRGRSGWKLVDFSRQIPSGKNPCIIERFVYELIDEQENVLKRAVGLRTEGEKEIVFDKDFV